MNAALPDDEDDVAETVVVDRAAVPLDDDIEGTIAIARPPVDDDEVDRTVVVDRGEPSGAAPDDEHTIVIPPGQERPGGPSRAVRGPGRAKRIRITLPDDTPASDRAAEGVGVGATDRYTPRPIPTAPVVELPEAGPDATRALAPAMPSVARASRRAGWRAVVLAVAACIVAVAGLAAIGWALTHG